MHASSQVSINWQISTEMSASAQVSRANPKADLPEGWRVYRE
jgi:hypothetical protein